MLNEGNQIFNFISGSGSGTVIKYGSGSGSDFLTSYGSGSEGKKLLFLRFRFRFRFHNTIPQTIRFFRLPHQQIYTFHQCIFIIYSAMGPLWVFTGYLLLKSAFNIRILQIPVTSLSPTYRKVNCLFVLAKYWVPTVQLLFLCLSHSYLPILYNNCLIYTYHLFSFCQVICPACLYFVLQKWIVFLFVTGTECTVFTIYQKNFYFFAGNQSIYPQNENCYLQAVQHLWVFSNWPCRTEPLSYTYLFFQALCLSTVMNSKNQISMAQL